MCIHTLYIHVHVQCMYSVCVYRFVNILPAASVDAFGGAAPGWVYAECARPFTELLGMQGYHLTVSDHGLWHHFSLCVPIVYCEGILYCVVSYGMLARKKRESPI